MRSKTFVFTKYEAAWRTESSFNYMWICFEEVNRFFYIPKRVREIEVTLSDTRPRHKNYVELHHRRWTIYARWTPGKQGGVRDAVLPIVVADVIADIVDSGLKYATIKYDAPEKKR